MSSRRHASIRRDQDATPFGATLMRLCDNTAALGAALVDQQGETVDYAGAVDPYEIRVAAAEWRLVLRALGSSLVPGWSETTEFIVRGRKRSFAVVALPEGYAVVMQLARHCFGVSARALAEAVREISLEAGLELPRELEKREHWSRVEVRSHSTDARRPESVWVGGAWCRVEVLGRYQLRGETGYRVRLQSGAEINLVREKLGRWWAEDLPSH